MMNFLNPKAYLVATGSLEEPWLALTHQENTRKHVSRTLITGSLLLGGLLLFGFIIPVTAYNALSSRSTNALLATAQQSANDALATFAVPKAIEPSAPAAHLSGTTGAIGETAFAPAVSAGSTAAVLRIDKIGVTMPIIEGEGEGALWKGAWRSPWGSTPEAGGNTVLFGHRFLHLPPHPNTMFRLDELVLGDTFQVDWAGKTYTYRVSEIKVVDPSNISVLNQTGTPTVTLITCTPKFTTQQRLVVHATRI